MSAYVPARRPGMALLMPHLAVRHRVYVAAGVLVTLLVVAVLSARLLWPTRAELAERESVNARNPVVELKSTHAESRLGYLTITGALVNCSQKLLRNVEAVVEYYDPANQLVRVDSALIEIPVLAPGSDSAFEVHSRDSGGVASYRVRFRTLLGAEIPSARDRR